MTADAGSRGNLGNVDIKGGQQPRGQRRLRTFLQVELGGFAQVGDGFRDGVALASRCRPPGTPPRRPRLPGTGSP
jgi:hypothetical protein